MDDAVSGSFVSDVIPAVIVTQMSIEFATTGGVSGIVSLEASNSGDFWATVDDSTDTIDAIDPVYIIEMREATSQKYRVRFDYTAGAGEVIITMSVKGR